MGVDNPNAKGPRLGPDEWQLYLEQFRVNVELGRFDQVDIKTEDIRAHAQRSVAECVGRAWDEAVLASFGLNVNDHEDEAQALRSLELEKIRGRA